MEKKEVDQEELKKLQTKPLIKYSDMPTEMGGEAVEIITMAIDKHQAKKNYESAAQMIKNTMDKKFGSTWHCIIGEGFGFDVTCQRKYLLHIYYGCTGVLCYKS
ncbi:Dynein light chain 4, axonemal [Chaetoceros tenuissimus]|uniref:Dynein light chain n=1 Tax=Chaetoceros tenuissimus TaxID=426638 RepID=A0AAD3CT82_9STRA|nr:Dynein light chain 4, axonemal [Chaetoceros tenuissimus]